jgi:hypothetical protein
VSGADTPTGRARIWQTKSKKSRYVTVNLVKGNATYAKRGHVRTGAFRVTK